MKTLHQEPKKNEEERQHPTSCMILKTLGIVQDYSKENYCKAKKIVCQSPVAWLSRDKIYE